MSLCVALGYCRKDREQAVRWLESVKQLGALREHRLFLLPAFDCEPIPEILPFTGLTDLRRVASEWSATAPSADASGPNSVFRTFSRYFRDNKLGPWFFCEPDCILLVPDALDRLEAEYLSARAPFMGAYVDRPIPRLNGTMICPQDAANIASIALPMRTPDNRLEIAFDVACAQDIMPRAHRTNLIQNVYGSAPFASREDFDARVSREAVCYHSEKSMTIFQYLGGAVHAEPLADGSQSADSVRLTEADPPAQNSTQEGGDAPCPMKESPSIHQGSNGAATSEPEAAPTSRAIPGLVEEDGTWAHGMGDTITPPKPWKELTADEKTERRRQQMAVARASRGKPKAKKRRKRGISKSK